MSTQPDENSVATIIVDSAFEVHKILGVGLLESVYEEALCAELVARNLLVERQKPVPILYKGKVLATPLRLDLLVANCVIVECKAATAYDPIWENQTLTYLRLGGYKLGLVINFGARLLKHQIHRVVNGL